MKQEKNMKKNMNRRQWIGSVGLCSLGGVVAGGMVPQEVFASTVIAGGRTFETDILVCGGGPAGFAAAVNAARLGQKVLLLERYGRLGGMGIHARVFPLLGWAESPFLREVHKKIGGARFDMERLDLQYADMMEQSGASLLLHVWATEPIMQGSKVVGVKAISKEGVLTIRARLVIDATGDGDMAALAGAPVEMGREEDGLVQPMSIMFTIRGAKENAQTCGSEEEARVRKAGEETWEDVVTRAQKNGELPSSVGVVRTYQMPRQGVMIVNAMQINRLFGTKVEDLTKAELTCRRQAYQIVDFMKKYLNTCPVMKTFTLRTCRRSSEFVRPAGYAVSTISNVKT